MALPQRVQKVKGLCTASINCLTFDVKALPQGHKYAKAKCVKAAFAHTALVLIKLSKICVQANGYLKVGKWRTSFHYNLTLFSISMWVCVFLFANVAGAVVLWASISAESVVLCACLISNVRRVYPYSIEKL